MRAGRAIAAAGLPTQLSEVRSGPFPADALIAHMAQDKKAEAGALTFVLARGLGAAFVAKAVDPDPLRHMYSSRLATRRVSTRCALGQTTSRLRPL